MDAIKNDKTMMDLNTKQVIQYVNSILYSIYKYFNE